jgi:hypothetical protein
VIREIAGMGHEIGYHYENLSACKGDPGRRLRGSDPVKLLFLKAMMLKIRAEMVLE